MTDVWGCIDTPNGEVKFRAPAAAAAWLAEQLKPRGSLPNPCIMSSEADLVASAACEDNHEPYIRMVELEVRSSFAFQGSRWLSDVAPHVLPPSLRSQAQEAKAIALQRQVVEAEIPQHLLYAAGWPTCLPTRSEAELLARVRRQVSSLLGLNAQCLDAGGVHDRYAELLALKEAKGKGTALEDDLPAQAELCFG